jgi:hypothetical protein
MKTQIKTFIAAHKTAIMIGSVLLVLASRSISQNFEEGYNNGYGQPGYAQRYGQQRPQQQPGFFSRWFGGNDPSTENYSNNGYAANAYYGAGSAGSSYTANSGADYTSGYDKQQAAYDRASENYSDYMRDQANYDDGYGNSYKLNSGYSNSYVNSTTGEYVQSNDANYDPNAGSTSSWTEVTPSSSYSSSSSSTSESE